MSTNRRNLLLGTFGAALSGSAHSHSDAHSEVRQIRTALQLKRLPQEPALEPDMPIIDPHHHLWFISETLIASLKSSTNAVSLALTPVVEQRGRYLLEEYLKDIQESGHNIVASVYAEAGSMYRAQGPATMRSVGEVEFANGAAAMAASGIFGSCRACAGIVAIMPIADLDGTERALNAYIEAGNGRLRGVRAHFLDEDRSNLQNYLNTLKAVQKLGLSVDIAAIEPMLPEAWKLANAFENVPIILDHVGLPMGIGRCKGKREERFPLWLKEIRRLSKCPNVTVKLGGLGMPIAGLPSFMSHVPATSEQLAEEWRPYIQSCIEEFGANRCMFESDFPADALTCSYSTLWNTFKRLASQGSSAEKTSLFHDTARRVYRLTLET